MLSKLEFSAKEEFIKGFVSKPIDQIERKVDEAKANRRANKNEAINVGNALYNQTKNSLSLLKSVLGNSNIKFVSVSDKVSDEILQCGIDYFKLYKDTDNDPSQVVMNLFKIANSLACGNIAKQRCQENTENLQQWIDDKPERDKQKLIGEDLKFIASKLEGFQNLSDTISNAKDLIDNCKPKLQIIKKTLGSSDDFYLKLSSAVANNALGMLVTSVNKAQESIEVRLGDFSSLRSIVRAALAVSESIGTFDMASQQRTHYSKNHTALKSISSQLGVNGSSYSTSSSSGSTSTYSPKTSSNSSSSSSSSSNNWPLWVVIAGAVIGLIAGGFGGLLAGGFIGLILVGLLSNIID